MRGFTKDPLLSAAYVLLAIVYGAIVFVMIMVLIGLGAAMTVERGELLTHIAEAGLAPGTIWLVGLGLLAFALILFLTLRFVTHLMRITKSVELGDPFIPENARRLSAMGWLMLAIHLIGMPLAIGAAYLSKLTGEGDLTVDSGAGGIVLVVTLFILARVFRKGAEMREELEGTV